MYSAGKFDIYWLGITIVIGGQLIYWNQGLAEGFWPFFVSTLVVGSGYLCLTLCLSEMTSFLPFAGGSWGYARCALGPIPGFLVGICETIEYVLYVTSAVLELGNLISIILGYSPAYEPLYWLLFFAISLFLQIYNTSIFWRFNTIIGAMALLLIIVYFLTSIPAFDYEQHLGNRWSRRFYIEGSAVNFLYFFPLPSWFYVGVEVMTLSCSEVKDANKFVPQAMIACIFTLLVTSFLVLFGSCLQSPGAYFLFDEVLPLNPGYQTAFSISSRIGTMLAIPGTFATAFGFMFAYGRQIYSMSTSGLFPHFLSQTFGEHKAPITALFLGSTLSYGTLLFFWYIYPNFARQLFNLCMLGSCSVYVALFRSYMVCQKRYSNLPRQFINYFGTVSAVYGMTVFCFMIVTLAFFQRDGYIAIIVFASFIAVSLLYYFLVVQKREFFSDEEQAKFMKAYILNASEKRKNFKQQRGRAIDRLFTSLTFGIITPPLVSSIGRKPISRPAIKKKASFLSNITTDRRATKLHSFFTLSFQAEMESTRSQAHSDRRESKKKVTPAETAECVRHSNHSKVPSRDRNLRSSNFAQTLNNLESAVDSLYAIATSASAHSQGSSALTTSPTSVMFESNSESPQFNQVVTITIENLTEDDWFGHSHRKQHSLMDGFTSYSRSRSSFFNINGNLVHLSETLTTISHC